MKWLSGSFYTGHWKNGKRHGSGRMEHWDGHIQEGTFVVGKLEGHAVEINTSIGIKWQGEYINGMKNYLNGYTDQINPISNLLKRRAISINSLATTDETDAEQDNNFLHHSGRLRTPVNST